MSSLLLHTRPQRPPAHTLEPSFVWLEMNPGEDLERWQMSHEDYREQQKWKKAKERGEQKLAKYKAALAEWQTRHPKVEQLHQDALAVSRLRVTADQVENDIQSAQAVFDESQRVLTHNKKRRIEIYDEIQNRKARHTDLQDLAYLACPSVLIEE